MMKKTFTWSVSNGFAVLLLTVGTILAIITLGISFGSPISVDAMVTAAALASRCRLLTSSPCENSNSRHHISQSQSWLRHLL